jgi:hypothetical protein
MNPWVVASLISFCLLLIVYIFARKGGLTRIQSLMLSISWYPAPLLVIGGANSYVYAIDMVSPFIIFNAIKTWRRTKKELKLASIFIVISAGCFPLLMTFIYAESRITFLVSIMNLYRLIIVISLMIYFAGLRNKTINESNILLGFSLGSVFIALSMLLQGQGIINSNITALIGKESGLFNYDLLENLDEKYVVLGMWKSTLGYFGSIAIILGTLNSKETKIRSLTIFAGLIIVLLSGAKSAMFAATLIYIYNSLRSKKLYGRVKIILASIITGAIIVWAAYSFKEYLPILTQKLITGDQEGYLTLTYRTSRFQDSLSVLAEHPEILLGFMFDNVFKSLNEPNYEVNLSFFHNEYLSILFFGGIWSLSLYLLSLFILYKKLFKGESSYPIFQEFASLVFLNGCIQASTISHLQPSLVYVSGTALMCSIYGLGSIPSFEAPKEIMIDEF